MRCENHDPSHATLIPLATALENAFDLLNTHLFDEQLEKPVITLQPGQKTRAYGWMSVAYCWVWNGGEQQQQAYRELNIACDYLSRPFLEVATTLLHEMVHIRNSMDDVQDVARRGIRHNRKFVATAEQHGMEGFKGDDFQKAGWRVRFTPETEAFVTESLTELAAQLTIYRTADQQKVKTSKKPLKYVCPECGVSVRATKNVNIECRDCGCLMELEDSV